MRFTVIQKKKYLFFMTFVLFSFVYVTFSLLGQPGLKISTNTRYVDKIPREDNAIKIPRENDTIKIPREDDNIINRFEYLYPINVENACKTMDIFVFMPVNSAVSNFYRRNLTRNSQHGKFALENKSFIRMMFFVGIPSTKIGNTSIYQKKLEIEAKAFGDIVQINVADSYHNLSLKAVGTLNWISKYCSNPEFILKLDDDVVVDPLTLLSVAYKLGLTHENFVVGNKGVNQKPIRHKNKKHTMTEKEFPNSTFPPFAFGPAQAFPTTTAILLYKQALRTKMIFLDDVFITGICRLALGIPVFHNDKFKTLSVHKKIKAENFVLSD